MFNHAYNGYLKHAYPYDELRPLTCDGVDTWGRFVSFKLMFFITYRLRVWEFIVKEWSNSVGRGHTCFCL